MRADEDFTHVCQNHSTSQLGNVSQVYEGVDLDWASCRQYPRVTFQAIATPVSLWGDRALLNGAITRYLCDRLIRVGLSVSGTKDSR